VPGESLQGINQRSERAARRSSRAELGPFAPPGPLSEEDSVDYEGIFVAVMMWRYPFSILRGGFGTYLCAQLFGMYTD